MELLQSTKLSEVCYDIRGPVLEEAKRLEASGRSILKLNIGNPAPFGFTAPDELLVDIVANLTASTGYSDSQGVLSARVAVAQHYQEHGLATARAEHVWLGNGVSELIVMSMQALLNDGDEVLIPAPDYPLWTAAVTLAGGRPVHYRCDESAGWLPDLDDVRAKAGPRTKAIIVINPNNPTGAVYPRAVLDELVQVAREHALVLCADEIYDKILYDGATHVPVSTIADDVFTLTFTGRLASGPGGCSPAGRASTRAATSRASRSWPTCGCVRTSQPSTRSRRRSADDRASRSWCSPEVGCATSVTPPWWHWPASPE